MPASKLNAVLLPLEFASFGFKEAEKAGNLKLKDGAGGTSKEKGYGLFMQIICTKFEIPWTHNKFRIAGKIIISSTKINHFKISLNLSRKRMLIKLIKITRNFYRMHCKLIIRIFEEKYREWHTDEFQKMQKL